MTEDEEYDKDYYHEEEEDDEEDDKDYYHEEDEEEEEMEYTGLMALLHDEEKEPHVHLAILLIITFIVAIIVYFSGL